MQKKYIKLILELLAVCTLFFGVLIVNDTFQKPLTHNNGHGWDGEYYYRVADSYIHNVKPSEKAPFVYRIAVPWLVSKISPNNIKWGFEIINYVSCFLITILLWLILRLYLHDWRVKLFLIFFYLTSWAAPLRNIKLVPFDADPLALFFLFLSFYLLLVLKNRKILSLLLSIICFFSVLCREIMMLPAIIFILTNIEFAEYRTIGKFKNSLKRIKLYEYLPLITSLFGFILIRMSIQPTNNFTYPMGAISNLLIFPFAKYILSIFIAYSVLGLLPIYYFKESKAFLLNNKTMLYFISIIILLSIIGGADFERYLLWAAPVGFTLIGILIEKNFKLFKNPLLIIFIGLNIIFNQRLFWTLPDYNPNNLDLFIILNGIGNQGNYLDLWTFFANYRVNAIKFVEYSISIVIFLKFIQSYQSKLKSNS